MNTTEPSSLSSAFRGDAVNLWKALTGPTMGLRAASEVFGGATLTFMVAVSLANCYVFFATGCNVFGLLGVSVSLKGVTKNAIRAKFPLGLTQPTAQLRTFSYYCTHTYTMLFKYSHHFLQEVGSEYVRDLLIREAALEASAAKGRAVVAALSEAAAKVAREAAEDEERIAAASQKWKAQAEEKRRLLISRSKTVASLLSANVTFYADRGMWDDISAVIAEGILPLEFK